MPSNNKKPSYFPWNEEEFQADVFVRGMTPLQRWMYRTLLQSMFWATTRPYLPNDDEQLAVLAGCESLEQWVANKDKILRRFSVIENDGETVLANKRVESDWSRLEEKREKMADLGQRSAAARQQANDGSTHVERTSGACLIVANGVPAPVTQRKSQSTDTEREKAQTSNTATDCVFSSKAKQNLGGDWSTIAIRHKRIFGRQASISHKEKYAEFCARFSEEIVLECFEDWSQDAKDWVDSAGVKQPLFAFWKKLPDMAETAIGVRAAEKQETDDAVTAAAVAQTEAAAILASERRQADENWKRLTTPGKILGKDGREIVECDILSLLPEVPDGAAAESTNA
jgi:hypothetical protein